MSSSRLGAELPKARAAAASIDGSIFVMACKATASMAAARLIFYSLLTTTILAGTVSTAKAASSMSVSLTEFTGDSTLPATQAAVGAAGLNFYSTAGADPEFTIDPTIVLSNTGAAFGSLFGGDNGRNYMRTNDSDYATVSFTAEITIERTNGISQQVFLGMGAGDTALFGVADWSTLFSSTFTTPEEASFTTWRSSNDGNVWTSNAAVPVVGSHRVRMQFDSVARVMVYSMDIDYTGGPFVADATAAPVDLNHVDCLDGCGDPPGPISADFYGPDGWPNEPSRIFFGGDDGAIYRDFTVVVSAPPALTGDYNNDGDVDAADYTVWRNNVGNPGDTLQNRDPANGTGAVGPDDYTSWKENFGAGGGGSIGGAVPEPSALGLMLVALGLFAAVRPSK